VREEFIVLGENLADLMASARAGCFGDSEWFLDAYQQMWVEVAFLAERRERTNNSMELSAYLLANMRDRIRIFYEAASNVVQPPQRHRSIKNDDDYSDHAKQASVAAQRSKDYTSYDSFEDLM